MALIRVMTPAHSLQRPIQTEHRLVILCDSFRFEEEGRGTRNQILFFFGLYFLGLLGPSGWKYGSHYFILHACMYLIVAVTTKREKCWPYLTDIHSFTLFWELIFQHGNVILVFSCDRDNTGLVYSVLLKYRSTVILPEAFTTVSAFHRPDSACKSIM